MTEPPPPNRCCVCSSSLGPVHESANFEQLQAACLHRAVHAVAAPTEPATGLCSNPDCASIAPPQIAVNSWCHQRFVDAVSALNLDHQAMRNFARRAAAWLSFPRQAAPHPSQMASPASSASPASPPPVLPLLSSALERFSSGDSISTTAMSAAAPSDVQRKHGSVDLPPNPAKRRAPGGSADVAIDVEPARPFCRQDDVQSEDMFAMPDTGAAACSIVLVYLGTGAVSDDPCRVQIDVSDDLYLQHVRRLLTINSRLSVECFKNTSKGAFMLLCARENLPALSILWLTCSALPSLCVFLLPVDRAGYARNW